jgi:hypothetical protein
MKSFDLSEIVLSRNDEKRELRLPDTITPELAEDVGIMTGDGHISIQRRPTRVDYEVSCTGNSVTDSEFIKEYVMSLKQKLFNLKFRLIENNYKNSIAIRAKSRVLVDFYSKIVGLPLGSKYKIGVPELIKKLR